MNHKLTICQPTLVSTNLSKPWTEHEPLFSFYHFYFEPKKKLLYGFWTGQKIKKYREGEKERE